MKTLALLLLFPLIAWAKPLAIAQDGDVTITLTDEPCRLTEVVNLPARATWTEKGKTFEGCWGVGRLVVMSYWSDHTVAELPREAFKKAIEI